MKLLSLVKIINYLCKIEKSFSDKEWKKRGHSIITTRIDDKTSIIEIRGRNPITGEISPVLFLKRVNGLILFERLPVGFTNGLMLDNPILHPNITNN